MFTPPTKVNGETKSKNSSKTDGSTKSFVLKVIFPPVGIAHRHSNSFNKDALNELHHSSLDTKGASPSTKKIAGARIGSGTAGGAEDKATKKYKPQDKGGFMKKRGHTVHLMTSNFKTRWFELDATNLLLTYYETQPPTSIMGDGEQNQQAEEKKKEMKKGAVDLSIVEEIRPSEHKKERSFDLVTITRTWVLYPSSDEDEAGWLANLCKIVPSDGVHESFKEYIHMDPNASTKIHLKKNTNKKSSKKGGSGHAPPPANSNGTSSNMGAEIDSQNVRCDPKKTTVGMVLSECFRLFKRRTGGQEMDIGGPERCALKVTGLREFMYTQTNLIADYQYVHSALVAGERDGTSLNRPMTVELQLVPSDVLQELLFDTKHATHPGNDHKNTFTHKKQQSIAEIVEVDEEEDGEEEEEVEEVGELRSLSGLSNNKRRGSSIIPEKEAIVKRRTSVFTQQNGDWVLYVDPESKEPFWYNEKDNISQWEEPLDWKRESISASTINDISSSVQMGEAYIDALLAETTAASAAAAIDEEEFASSPSKCMTNIELEKELNQNTPWSCTEKGLFSSNDSQREHRNKHHHRSSEKRTFSKRNARWPLRIHIESLHDLQCFENRYVSKEIVTFPIEIVKVCVRMRVMVGGQPILGGTMETIPVPYERGMRYIHGFQNREGEVWLSTKLNISSLPPSARLFIEVLGEKEGKDYEGICDVILSSVCVQLCDHTGRMLHGRRALKLWPEVDVPAREVGHVCPTPWSQTMNLDDDDDNDDDDNDADNVSTKKKKKKKKPSGSTPSLPVIDEDALRKKMAALMSGTLVKVQRNRPTLHLSFDQFQHPIVFNHHQNRQEILKNSRKTSNSAQTKNLNKKFSSMMQVVHDMNTKSGSSAYNEEEIMDLSMSGMLEVEKKNKWGKRKWKEYWVVLEERLGTLSWYSSKRSDAKCLGCIELASVDVEECPTKKRIYKKGKGTTLKDAETCCFKVNITGEERNRISGKYGNAIVYFAHVSRREVRAWMDAIAKVGLTQSEHLENIYEEEESGLLNNNYGNHTNRSISSSSPERQSNLRRGTLSSGSRSRHNTGDSGGGNGEHMSESNRQRRNTSTRRNTGFTFNRSSVGASGMSDIRSTTGFNQDGDYVLNTLRSDWFDDLEGLTNSAGPMRPLKQIRRNTVTSQQYQQKVDKKNSTATSGTGENIHSNVDSSHSNLSSLPLMLCLLDPLLMIDFCRQRNLSDEEQGTLLIYTILTLLRQRKKRSLSYGDARGIFTRFEDSTKKKKMETKIVEGNSTSTLSRKGSVGGLRKKKSAPPPPPDAVYVSTEYYNLITQALSTKDLSSCPELTTLHNLTKAVLIQHWKAYVPTLQQRVLNGPKRTDGADDSVNSSLLFYWERSRYLVWWFTVSDEEKTVDLLHISRRLRAMEKKEQKQKQTSNSMSLSDKYTLSETMEYVASTIFELGMNSTQAVDFLHYHRHGKKERSDGAVEKIEKECDVLPSGSSFNMSEKMKSMVPTFLKTLSSTASSSTNISNMLGPIWYENLEKEKMVESSLWEDMFVQMFEEDDYREEDDGVTTNQEVHNHRNDMNKGEQKNATDATVNVAGGNISNIEPRRSTKSTTTLSSSSSTDTTTTTGSNNGTTMTSSSSSDAISTNNNSKRFRRRRGSTRDPLVFVEENDKIEKVIRTDPLHELSANEKALLWRHRKRLPERFRFAALPKLLRAVNWFNHQEKTSMLELLSTWPKPEPDQILRILELLDEAFHEPLVRKYATNCLDDLTDSSLTNCLPQLVQALKYEPYHMSDLAIFLLRRALLSPILIGLPFFWCCKVELRGPHCRERYSLLIHCYLMHCGPVQRALVDQQAHLWSEEGAFAGVAAAVYACKGQGKKKYISVLRSELDKLAERLPDEFSLPIDPRMICSRVKVEKCRVMSSAKLPLWLVFENADPLGEDVLVMFKAGDDLRQDTMVLQLIRNMDALYVIYFQNLYYTDLY